MSRHKELYKLYLDDLSEDVFEEWLVNQIVHRESLITAQVARIEALEAGLGVVRLIAYDALNSRFWGNITTDGYRQILEEIQKRSTNALSETKEDGND
jgi:hypothetical protein